MRHREAAEHGLAALHVDQHPSPGLVLPPAARGVGFAESGDVGRLIVDHAETVLVAAIQSSPRANAISWMRMSPVKCLLRGTKQASCLPGGSTLAATAGKSR